MKKFLALATSVMLAAGTMLMSGCGMAGSNKGDTGSGGNAAIQLKVGFGSSIDTSAGGQGLKKFKELVEQKSNGKIEVQLFGDGQLGNDKTMMEALQMGTLDMTLPTTSPVAELSPAFLAFDMPFLFTEPAQAYKVLDGAPGKDVMSTLDEKGIHGLVYFENGFRNLTNSKHPIKNISDLEGLKIRTMQNPIMLDTFTAWGANPVPMAFNEVFTALEQKTIDGQENPNVLIYDAGFYEAQKYLTESHHLYSPYLLMIGEKKWKSLSAEDQKLIQECAEEARDYERQLSQKIDTEYLQKMKDKGIQVDELTPDAIQKMKDLSKPIYDNYADKIGKDRFDAILKAAADK